MFASLGWLAFDNGNTYFKTVKKTKETTPISFQRGIGISQIIKKKEAVESSNRLHSEERRYRREKNINGVFRLIR